MTARRLLIAGAVFAIGLFLIVPLVAVFAEAFREGAARYFAALKEPDALSAMKLTALAVLVAVPVNTAIGLAAGWALGKFTFPGRSLLLTLVDLPFAVSPVVAGMLFVLLFGRSSALGPFFLSHGVKILFAPPAIFLATIFVTFPFVARELVPLMQSQGPEEEEAARLLGAGFWRTLLRVTLPNVKWGLLYGITLCAARAAGEFGAVSVVSGHIRGFTNTLPLHVEILYNEYRFAAAFAVASLLTGVALVTLLVKVAVEGRADAGGERR